RYSGRFAVSIRLDGDDWLVHLEVPPDTEADALQGEFLRAALDEQLREWGRGRTAAPDDAVSSAALTIAQSRSGRNGSALRVRPGVCSGAGDMTRRQQKQGAVLKQGAFMAMHRFDTD